jgi:hypothetical protein
LGVEEDQIKWKLTDLGVYSAKLAYNAFFLGRVKDTAAPHLWTSGTPLIHKLHAWFSLKRQVVDSRPAGEEGTRSPSSGTGDQCPHHYSMLVLEADMV